MKRATDLRSLMGSKRETLRLSESVGKAAESGHLIRIVQNTGWLLGERAIVMLMGMLVGIWIARYLGPADFGTYSYALSIVALFGFLPVFGLQGIVTRELVKTPENKEEILGTVLALRLIGGLLGVSFIFAFVIQRSGDLTTRLMIAIIAVGLLFDGFGVIDLWFQSRTENKYGVIARSSALISSMFVKVLLVLVGAPLIAFAGAEVLQHALRAVGFILAYRWSGHILWRWRRNWALARTLLRQSWPVVVSSAGALVYLKIDQVMIGEMVGAREVGIYAVAARVSEVWYVIPMALATSIFPLIVRSRHQQDPRYDERLQQAYIVMAWLAVAIAVTVTIVASPIIRVLFGTDYAGASSILAIHIWTCPAVFMGAVLNKWLVAEDLLMFALTRHGLGAAINVGLNLLLIPTYGGMGAAVATLVSYTVAHYLACYTDPRTRSAGQKMTRALFAPVLLFVKVRRGGHA